jgi:RNA polymerase sigma factor (sigma-70 family)
MPFAAVFGLRYLHTDQNTEVNMFTKNSGSNEHDILQNQFTAFLATALNNRRLMYLRSRIRRLHREIITEDLTVFYVETEEFNESLFSDSEALRHALKELKEKERFVLLARVIDEKSFDEIGAKLGIGYKGAAAIYYRTIAKLKKLLGGDCK